MIELKKGDIIHCDAEALVNTVNCVGVMGRGVALQFRESFPENYKQYKDACRKNIVVPGRMFVFTTNKMLGPGFIINFPTKRHWRDKSRIEDIESGLNDLVNVLKDFQIMSVAIPPLGCGLGGLDWNIVRPIIEKTLSVLPNVKIYLFEPGYTVSTANSKIVTDKPKLTTGRAALIALIGKYLEALMDESISLLEIHKLLYFLQFAGEPLRLKYVKALYGPYAENLRHVLGLLNKHYISGYDDRIDSPGKPIEVLGNSIYESLDYLRDYPQTMQNFHKVCSLINGFESPFGMELLSTVHWVAQNENASRIEKAIECIYKWNNRKKMFTEGHINKAWDVLLSQGWIGSVKNNNQT